MSDDATFRIPFVPIFVVLCYLNAAIERRGGLRCVCSPFRRWLTQFRHETKLARLGVARLLLVTLIGVPVAAAIVGNVWYASGTGHGTIYISNGLTRAEAGSLGFGLWTVICGAVAWGLSNRHEIRHLARLDTAERIAMSVLALGTVYVFGPYYLDAPWSEDWWIEVLQRIA
jgi:hypothetical protein